jgi:hypothetical protein
MSQSSYGALGAEQIEQNEIQIPRGSRACKGPHKWDPTIINNKAVGYIPVAYVHQEYPKMLYHPTYGKLARPNINHFASMCRPGDSESYKNALEAFMAAEQKWERGNRYKIVESKEREDELIAKGWLLTQPVFKSKEKFDMGSDEI